MSLVVGPLAKRRLAEAEAARHHPEPLSLAERFATLMAMCAPAAPPAANDTAPASAPCASAKGDVYASALRELEKLSPLEARRLLWDWRFWARATQLPPADDKWAIWLILSGRGWGKTMTGAQTVRRWIEEGTYTCGGLIGPTIADVWDTMIYGQEGAPGLLNVFPPHRRPEPREKDRKVVFHREGCDRKRGCACPFVKLYTGEEPEVRGPNFQFVWWDEAAKCRYAQTIWENIQLANRKKGKRPPRMVVTTTPRPLQLIVNWLNDPGVRLTVGSSFANVANVSAEWIERMRLLQGTRLGKQELEGGILLDNPEAMFHQRQVEAGRVERAPELRRVIIAVDPAISTKKKNDLTGIVALGEGVDGELYVLLDLTGVELKRDEPGLSYDRPKEPKKHSPEEWGEIVMRAYLHFGAEAIVGERNRGGDLVASNVRAAAYRKAVEKGKTDGQAKTFQASVRIEEVIACKGKETRAEPVSTLYEKGMVHHVGFHPELEEEITTWNPRADPESPNRLDALVWGAHYLVGFDEPQMDPNVAAAGVAEANEMFVESRWGRPESYDAI